jgi:hypothetical protein
MAHTDLSEAASRHASIKRSRLGRLAGAPLTPAQVGLSLEIR